MKSISLLKCWVVSVAMLGWIACSIESGGRGDPDAGQDASDGSQATDAGADASDEPACTDECQTTGQTDCLSGGVRTCGQFDLDDCLEWSEPVACEQDNQACQDGVCVTICEHECDADTRRCADQGEAYQECGQFDDDPCRDWGAAQACPEDNNCDEGFCVVGCQSVCEEGEKRCATNGVETCGDHDDDPCLEWGDRQACQDDEICRNAACVCIQECVQIGARRCSPTGNGFDICDNYDDDECLEWGTYTPCEDDTICAEGECVIDCGPQCKAGALRCSEDPGTPAIELCADEDQDTCYEWTTSEECAEDLECDPVHLTCAVPYPEGPYGSDPGDLLANICIEKALCSEGAPIGTEPMCMRDLLQHQAILITIHAGWCSVCQTQNTTLERLYQDYKELGLMILSVQIEAGQGVQDYTSVLNTACVEQDTYHFTFLEAIDPGARQLSRWFPVDAVPVNIIVDGDMTIRYAVTGWDGEQIEYVIHNLLSRDHTESK